MQKRLSGGGVLRSELAKNAPLPRKVAHTHTPPKTCPPSTPFFYTVNLSRSNSGHNSVPDRKLPNFLLAHTNVSFIHIFVRSGAFVLVPATFLKPPALLRGKLPSELRCPPLKTCTRHSAFAACHSPHRGENRHYLKTVFPTPHNIETCPETIDPTAHTHTLFVVHRHVDHVG